MQAFFRHIICSSNVSVSIMGLWTLTLIKICQLNSRFDKCNSHVVCAVETLHVCQLCFERPNSQSRRYDPYPAYLPNVAFSKTLVSPQRNTMSRSLLNRQETSSKLQPSSLQKRWRRPRVPNCLYCLYSSLLASCSLLLVISPLTRSPCKRGRRI